MNKEPNKNMRRDLIEVNITQANNSYSFGNQPNLTQYAKRIISIEAYSVTQMAKSPGGKTVVGESVIKNIWLKLYQLGNDDVIVASIPGHDLARQFGGQSNKPVFEDLELPPIDWQKSQIMVPDPTSLTLQESFVFKVKYEKS